jgi:hypothetical protein
MSPEDSTWQLEFRDNFERGFVEKSSELHMHACNVVAERSIRHAWIAISVSGLAIIGSVSQEMAGAYDKAAIFGAATIALGAVGKLYSNQANCAEQLALKPAVTPDIGLDNRGGL